MYERLISIFYWIGWDYSQPILFFLPKITEISKNILKSYKNMLIFECMLFHYYIRCFFCKEITMGLTSLNNILLDGFEDFNSWNPRANNEIKWYDLFHRITHVGGSMLHVEKKIGVWCALIAVIVAGITIMFTNSYNRRRFLKGRITTILVFICLFFALTGVVFLIASSGLD